MAGPDPCPHCAGMRRLVARLVSAGIDWMDEADAVTAELEDDEREIVSSDDGVVDAATLGRVLK